MDKFVLLIFVVLFVVIQSSDAAKECSVSGECASSECCRSNEQRRGRRKRALSGTCQPLRGPTALCLVANRAGTNIKADYNLYCPCKASLTCVSNQQIDHPWGPLGYCT
uniref:Toxin CSTX-20-like n=1 Tax=Gigantidas platifrons TaxID=2830794 RepID=A0A100XKN2_9BIVA